MCVLLEVSSEGVVTKEGLVGGGGVLIAPVTPRALRLTHRQTKGPSSLFLYHSHPCTYKPFSLTTDIPCPGILFLLNVCITDIDTFSF